MKSKGQHRLAVLGLALAVVATTGGTASARVPEVTIVRHAPALAYLMYPEFYRTVQDAAADTTYREESIDEATKYWEQNGERILTLVSELSGIAWQEEGFPLYFVEEAPTWGSPDPFILPVQYWRRGDLVRLGAVGNARAFVLAHLLTQRLISQAPEKDQASGAFRHPLFGPGLGTRDNMANLVAYWTIAELAGEAAALELIIEPGLVNESPGLKMLPDYLPAWRLTKKKPLVEWVKAEPTDSERVKKALGLRAELGLGAIPGRKTGEPERSRIGLRTRVNYDGDVVVVAVEPGRLAEKGDLQPGDVLVRVGGVSVANSRDVMSRLVAQLKNQKSVDLQVDRNGELVDCHMNMAWLNKTASP